MITEVEVCEAYLNFIQNYLSTHASYKMPELTRVFWTAINLTENVVFEGGLAVAIVHHYDGGDVFPQGHAILLFST